MEEPQLRLTLRAVVETPQFTDELEPDGTETTYFATDDDGRVFKCEEGDGEWQLVNVPPLFVPDDL